MLNFYRLRQLGLKDILLEYIIFSTMLRLLLDNAKAMPSFISGIARTLKFSSLSKLFASDMFTKYLFLGLCKDHK